MSRRLIILLAASVYGLGVLLVRRFRRSRAARRGLSLDRIAAFDHRALLDELEPLYRAGRAGLVPADATQATPSDGEEDSPSLPRPPSERFSVSLPLLGEAVAWAGAGDFDPAKDPAFAQMPEVIRQAATRLRAGELASVEALVEPGQSTDLDQRFSALGIHAFLTALCRGELERAGEVLAALPVWTNGRVATRLVEVYLGQLAHLQAEGASGRARHRFAREARFHLRQAAATSSFAEPAVRALWANDLLRFHTHALNLELMEFRIGRHLRRGLGEYPHSPVLFFELAYFLARRGQVLEAIDNLARAAYFSGSDLFYRRPLLEDPMVARLKPGLVRKVRAQDG